LQVLNETVAKLNGRVQNLAADLDEEKSKSASLIAQLKTTDQVLRAQKELIKEQLALSQELVSLTSCCLAQAYARYYCTCFCSSQSINLNQSIKL